MPTGLLKLAAVPTPFTRRPPPNVLFPNLSPASVAAFQWQGGCALKPGTVQAAAGWHATHAAVPFAYVPTGQVEAEKAQEVAPAVLNAPAAQGRQVAEVDAPGAVE